MENKVISSLREVDWKRYLFLWWLFIKPNGLSGGMCSKGI